MMMIIDPSKGKDMKSEIKDKKKKKNILKKGS
jgi:hypothetical protein